jgi:hypothetical protein
MDPDGGALTTHFQNDEGCALKRGDQSIWFGTNALGTSS